MSDNSEEKEKTNVIHITTVIHPGIGTSAAMDVQRVLPVAPLLNSLSQHCTKRTITDEISHRANCNWCRSNHSPSTISHHDLNLSINELSRSPLRRTHSTSLAAVSSKMNSNLQVDSKTMINGIVEGRHNSVAITMMKTNNQNQDSNKSSINGIKHKVLSGLSNKVAPLEQVVIAPLNQTSPGHHSSAESTLNFETLAEPIQVRCQSYDSMEDVCRICHDNPVKLTLITPCLCKGSMGLVHRSCLERWLGESATNACEICSFEYNTIRKPKYSGVESWLAWIRSPLSPNDTRNLCFDIACFFILSPLACLSTWLCIIGAQHYSFVNQRRANEQNDNINTLSSMWACIGLITLAGTLIVSYHVWLFVAARYHIQIWRQWQVRNFVVTIVACGVGDQISYAAVIKASGPQALQQSDKNNNINTMNTGKDTKENSSGSMFSGSSCYCNDGSYFYPTSTDDEFNISCTNNTIPQDITNLNNKLFIGPNGTHNTIKNINSSVSAHEIPSTSTAEVSVLLSYGSYTAQVNKQSLTAIRYSESTSNNNTSSTTSSKMPQVHFNNDNVNPSC